MTTSPVKLSDFSTGPAEGGVIDSYFVMDLPVVASMGAGVVNTTKQAYVTLPIDARIVSVQAMDDTQTGNVTVDIWNEAGTPATILGTVATLATALTSYAGVVSAPSTEYTQGSIFSLRCTTVASTGASTNLRVFLGLKSARGNVKSA